MTCQRDGGYAVQWSGTGARDVEVRLEVGCDAEEVRPRRRPDEDRRREVLLCLGFYERVRRDGLSAVRWRPGLVMLGVTSQRWNGELVEIWLLVRSPTFLLDSFRCLRCSAA